MLPIPDMNDRNAWGAIAERLNHAVQTVGDISPDLHRRVPNDDLWQFKALIDTGDDIFSVTLVTFWAIDELGKQPPKVKELWPEGGHGTEDRLRIWAADPAGHKRPQWTVIAMAATAWCNVLEGFLSGVSQTAINQRAIDRVRVAFPDADIDWTSLDLARAAISQRMLPSTKRKGQSLKYLEAVFGCQIDPVIALGIRALVMFRNSVIHPKRGRTHDEHQVFPSADQWIAWAGAVRSLAGTLIRALADRLDERRAAGEVIPLFPELGR